MKFYVDALHSFKVMLRTKKGWTDGLTDWGAVNFDHPGIVPVKFGQNPMSGFRGEDV